MAVIGNVTVVVTEAGTLTLVVSVIVLVRVARIVVVSLAVTVAVVAVVVAAGTVMLVVSVVVAVRVTGNLVVVT